MLRDAKHVAVITANQLFKRGVVAFFGRLYQRQLFGHGYGYFVFDGTHCLEDAVFSDVRLMCTVILLGNLPVCPMRLTFAIRKVCDRVQRVTGYAVEHVLSYSSRRQ